MAQNLNYKTTDSWCYDNKDSNCREYGLLYTWFTAKKACPNGWRLPSDHEWWTMASYYGKAYNSRSGQKENKTGDTGEAAYKALMKGGSTGFSALLGGLRHSDGDYYDLGSLGYYWSSTEKGASDAWGYTFSRYSQGLYRYSYDRSVARSCRCVQD